MNHRYPHQEKLKSKKDIEFLFGNGNQIQEGPLLLKYVKKDDCDSWIKFGVAARKKDFKKAVDRNKMKRNMRECFRLHKYELKEILKGEPYLMMLVFIKSEKINYSEMQHHYRKLLFRLSERLSLDSPIDSVS